MNCCIEQGGVNELLFIRCRKSSPLILKGVTLHMKDGGNVGIVGRSGCRKSTLGLLLFRLVESEEGTIVTAH